MAGNAAGAAKARAAARAKLAQSAQPVASDQTVDDADLIEPVAADRSLIGPVAGLPTVGQTVAPLVPLAVEVAGKILTGRIKASAAVRGNLAAEIMRQAGKGERSEGGQSAGIAAALLTIGKALGARLPRTIEAERAKVVTPTAEQ